MSAYLSSTLALGINMGAASSSFRTWCGAIDATDALAYLIKTGTPTPAPIEKARYAKLAIAADPDEEPGLGVIVRRGTIDFVFWRTDDENESDQARADDLLDLVSNVSADFYAMRGADGMLARFIIDPGEPVHYSPTGPQRGKSSIPLSLRWRG